MSPRAGRAADGLSRWMDVSLTAAIEHAVVSEWRRAGDKRSRSLDRKLATMIQAARSAAWYHFVRLSIGERRQAGVARRAGQAATGGGGSLGKYARGDVAVSAGALSFYERVALGSAQAYRSGPFGSRLWTCLTSESIAELWSVLEEHVPDVGVLRRGNEPFAAIVATLETERIRTLTSWQLSGDWSWGAVKSPLRAVMHGRDTSTGLLNPYCVAAALFAAYRIAGLCHHPEQVHQLYRGVHTAVLGGLRGAHALLSSANELDAILGAINDGLASSDHMAMQLAV
jgi:hypothetical protein